MTNLLILDDWEEPWLWESSITSHDTSSADGSVCCFSVPLLASFLSFGTTMVWVFFPWDALDAFFCGAFLVTLGLFNSFYKSGDIKKITYKKILYYRKGRNLQWWKTSIKRNYKTVLMYEYWKINLFYILFQVDTNTRIMCITGTLCTELHVLSIEKFTCCHKIFYQE